MFELEDLETTSPSHLHFTDEEIGSNLPKVTLGGRGRARVQISWHPALTLNPPWVGAG